jgi:hypothetical protein
MHAQTSDAGIPGAQSELALPARFLTGCGDFLDGAGAFVRRQYAGHWHLLGQTLPIGQRVAIAAYVQQGIQLAALIAVLAAYLSCRSAQRRLARNTALQLIDIWGGMLLGVTLYGAAGQRLAAWFALEQPGRVIELSGPFVMAAMPLTLFVTGVLTGSAAQKLLALLHALIGLALLAIPAQIEYSIAAGVTTTLHLASMLGTRLIPGLFLPISAALMRKSARQ